MKNRIIVMGLGRLFRKYQEEIYKRYEVIGVTSNNTDEANLFSDYIPLSQIHCYDFGYILICCAAEVEIVNQLIGEGIVEKDKILLASNIFWEGMFQSHSQYNEDVIVLLLLKLIGLKCSEVTYLELGTNHPIKLNNTYSLYKLGGKGVLVEPNRDLKNIIEIVRPRDRLINKAVSENGKPAEFYSLNTSVLGTLSYDKLDADYCKKNKDFEIKEIYQVETITINEIFRSMEKVPEVFSIDIEGNDYLILSQINYEVYRPIILIVEISALGVKEQEGNKIMTLLSRNSYKLFYQNGTNAIFIDKKYTDVIREWCNAHER